MSRHPSFRDLATMYAGPSTLDEAIASASFDHIGSSIPVRETLRAWTDTDEFIEMFRAAREGGEIPDEKFIESLSRRQEFASAPNAVAAARAISASLLQAWYQAAYRSSQQHLPEGEVAVPGDLEPPTEEGNPIYSFLVTIVAGLSMLGTFFGVIAMLFAIMTVVTSPRPSVALGLFALAGLAFCVGLLWLSIEFFSRTWWTRPLNIVLFGLGAVSSLIAALLGLSFAELLGAFFQAGVVYLLTRPEVIAEFEATRNKDTTEPDAETY